MEQTTVEIDFTVGPNVAPAAATSWVEWRATDMVASTTDPNSIILPASFSVTLVRGRATVTVDPTPADGSWAWEVTVHVANYDPTPVTLAVPESATPVQFRSLETRLNAATPGSWVRPDWYIDGNAAADRSEAAAVESQEARDAAVAAAAQLGAKKIKSQFNPLTTNPTGASVARSTTAQAFTGGTRVLAYNDALLNYQTGPVIQGTYGARNFSQGYDGSAAFYLVGFTITGSRYVSARLYNGGFASTLGVYVDRSKNVTGMPSGGATPYQLFTPADFSVQYLNLDLGNTGTHEVIFAVGAAELLDITVSAGATITRMQDLPKFIGDGDSYVRESIDFGGQGQAWFELTGLVMIGINQPGTGYTNIVGTTNGKSFYPSAARLTNYRNYSPGTLFTIVNGGLNDVPGTATAAQEQAAVTQYLSDRAAQRIIVVGVEPLAAYRTNPRTPLMNNAIAAGTALAANASFVDAIAGAWLTDANQATYIGSDGVHLNRLGNLHWVAMEILAIGDLPIVSQPIVAADVIQSDQLQFIPKTAKDKLDLLPTAVDLNNALEARPLQIFVQAGLDTKTDVMQTSAATITQTGDPFQFWFINYVAAVNAPITIPLPPTVGGAPLELGTEFQLSRIDSTTNTVTLTGVVDGVTDASIPLRPGERLLFVIDGAGGYRIKTRWLTDAALIAIVGNGPGDDPGTGALAGFLADDGTFHITSL